MKVVNTIQTYLEIDDYKTENPDVIVESVGHKDWAVKFKFKDVEFIVARKDLEKAIQNATNH